MHARPLMLALATAFPLALPTFADETEAPPSDAAGDVEEMVVWGVRTGSLPPIPGASTDVLFTDDYVGENKSLADLLSETEGISVRRFGAAGDRSEVTIRGSSPSQVVLTLDGVRANSILTGGADLSRVCLPLLDRVEVTRGGGSTREGSGAIGGVVNVVTRQPEGERTTRARFSGGSFDTYEGSLLHADSLGDLDLSLGYCGFTTDGDFDFERPRYVIDGVPAPFEPDSATRINNDQEQHGGTLALAHPLASGTLRFSDYAVYASGGEPGTDSDNGETAGQSTQAHARDLSNLAQLRWDGPSPSGLGADLELLAYHRWERARFRDPEAVLREPIDSDTKLSTLGLRAGDGWKGPLFGARDHRHELVLQADFAHDVLRGNRQNGRERPRAGGSLSETLRLFREKLVLSAGARLDWTEDFDPELLPSFGLVVAPTPWLRLRSHVERAYRAPNFEELYHPDEGFIRGNPDLSPEDAWNFDAGLELAFATLGPFSDLRLRGSWFRREIDESIVWILINPRTLAPVNTGSATIDGFELAASLELTRFLGLSANYTWTDSERDATGERLPGQAEEETNARLRIGPVDQWKLVGEVQRLDEILVNEGGSFELPSRTVWNASAAVDLAALPWIGLNRWVSELWVFAELNNISDEAVRDALSFPQPGRNGSAGVEVIW